MHKFTLLSLFILCFLSRSVSAQTNPTRDWGTYFGNQAVSINNVATDKFGNVYMVGTTTSGGKFELFGQLQTSPSLATAGSFQDTLNQPDTANSYSDIQPDAFLVKFNSAGVRQWATYYGGVNADYGNAVTCDTMGNVYMVGWTQSTSDVSTIGSCQASFGGGDGDGYLVKFDSSGVRQWATYYGGTNGEYIQAVAVDKNNNIYIGGTTLSTNGISTPGSFQPTFGGGNGDGFIAKFTSAGVCQWGTYYGDTLRDGFTSIVCDVAGNVYAGGQTTSLANIATPGSNQPVAGGGAFSWGTPYYDGFMVKFTADGQRVWGTYYGGNQDEGEITLAYSKQSNNVYIAGITSSANNIATSGGFQPQNYTTSDLEYDAFLASFDTSGARRWGTYYGGAGGILNSYTTGLACDAAGNILLSQTANVTGTNNIATPGSYQDTLSSAPDIIIVKFGNTGNRIWGTYFGSTGGSFDNDYSFGGLASDGSGNIYLAGGTSGTGNIATPGSFQDTVGSTSIYPFLEKFHDCLPDASVMLTGNTILCAGDSALLHANNDFAQTYQWQKDGADISGATDTVLTVNATGTYQLIVSNGTTCTDTSMTDTVTVHPLPVVTITANGNTLHAGSGFVAYQWNMGGQPISGATDSIYTITQTANYTVTVTDTNGCSVTSATYAATDGVANVVQNMNVKIYPNPASDKLYISASVPVNVTIYDMEGKQLLSAKKGNIIEIAQFAAGTYLLKISDEKGNLIKNDHFVKLN